MIKVDEEMGVDIRRLSFFNKKGQKLHLSFSLRDSHVKQFEQHSQCNCHRSMEVF